jgi:hypothetical protein
MTNKRSKGFIRIEERLYREKSNEAICDEVFYPKHSL